MNKQTSILFFVCVIIGVFLMLWFYDPFRANSNTNTNPIPHYTPEPNSNPESPKPNPPECNCPLCPTPEPPKPNTNPEPPISTPVECNCLLSPAAPNLPLKLEKPMFCVIARAWDPAGTSIPAFLLSLMRSGENVQVVVINTHHETGRIKRYVDIVSGIIDRKAIFYSPYGKTYSDSLWKPKPPDNDYGYTLTQLALDALLNRTQADIVPQHFRTHCTHILFTNADNLYSVELFGYLTKEIAAGHDAIGFNSISRHIHFHVRNPESMSSGQLDLGAGVVSIDLLRRLENHFLEVGGKVDLDYWMLDGVYWNKIRDIANSSKILEEVLFFHQ